MGVDEDKQIIKFVKEVALATTIVLAVFVGVAIILALVRTGLEAAYHKGASVLGQKLAVLAVAS